jgi:plastocyanin
MLNRRLLVILGCAAAGVLAVSGARHAGAAQHELRANATVAGRVTARPAPQRAAARYAAPGTSTATLQPVAPLVYIAGPGTPLATPAALRMEQRDTLFVPNVLVVPVGTTVRFINSDPFFHNVFSYSRTKRFDLGRFPRPEARTVTFDQAGIVEVFCEIHKGMRAVVAVVENAHYAVVEDGTFELPGVAGGARELIAWHPDRGQRTVRVNVPASGRVDVDINF